MRCSRAAWERSQALSCQQTHELIHGYVDGEVDLVKSLEIEQHLADCPACTQTYGSLRGLQSVLRNDALRFQPALDFEKRLRSAVRRESKSDQKPALVQWRWLLPVGLFTALVIGAFAIAGIFSRPSPD